ncbi:MAG: hypothetical protein AUJ72_01540 [Candidatus Omnitrophica bacterium CG1_02_46_14]|nr:MAG: hypothetical protein AUJ72_01540 [Candidatus Omnitrophica bacterium CG1_02_46_14]
MSKDNASELLSTIGMLIYAVSLIYLPIFAILFKRPLSIVDALERGMFFNISRVAPFYKE